MFGTIEEAAKAATMLQRFGKVGSITQAGPYGFGVFPAGVSEPFEDWEQVADYLLARQEGPREDHADKADKRAGLLAKARDWLRVARVMDPGLPQERTQALINAVDRLLEALA